MRSGGRLSPSRSCPLTAAQSSFVSGLQCQGGGVAQPGGEDSAIRSIEVELENGRSLRVSLATQVARGAHVDVDLFATFVDDDGARRVKVTLAGGQLRQILSSFVEPVTVFVREPHQLVRVSDVHIPGVENQTVKTSKTTGDDKRLIRKAVIIAVGKCHDLARASHGGDVQDALRIKIHEAWTVEEGVSGEELRPETGGQVEDDVVGDFAPGTQWCRHESEITSRREFKRAGRIGLLSERERRDEQEGVRTAEEDQVDQTTLPGIPSALQEHPRLPGIHQTRPSAGSPREFQSVWRRHLRLGPRERRAASGGREL